MARSSAEPTDDAQSAGQADAGQADAGQPDAGQADDDTGTADTVAGLARVADWRAAFALACRRQAAREAGPRTRMAAVRAVHAAAGDPAMIASLAGDAALGPLPLGLRLVAAAAGGPSLDLSRAPARAWEAGIFPWLDACDGDGIGRAMALLRPVVRAETLADELLGLVERMPAAIPGDRFLDQPWRQIQLARSPAAGTDRLLVCFAGARGGIGMPCNVFHRWAAGTGAHVLYLRDPVHQDFRDGVAEAGPDWAALVRHVTRLAESLGVARVACWGNSIGGLAAARLAQALGPSRAVVAAGIATARVPAAGTGRGLPDATAALAGAVRRQAVAAAAPARILWFYARDHGPDAADAMRMADVPGVVRKPLPTARHNVAAQLARSGRLASTLAWVTGSGGDLP